MRCSEKLIFEAFDARRSQRPVGRCAPPPSSDVPRSPSTLRRAAPPPLPEVSELQAVRHFTRLSQLNFSDRHALLPARLVHDEVQPAGLQPVRDAARVRSAGIRSRRSSTGQGFLAVPVRAAGDAEGSDRHAAACRSRRWPARRASSPASR